MHVSDKLPIGVVYDEQTNVMRFAIVRQNEEVQSNKEYIESLNWEASRNKVIKHISNRSNVFLSSPTYNSSLFDGPNLADPLFEGPKPNQVEIINTFNEDEFVVVLFFSLLSQARFYRCTLDSEGAVFSSFLEKTVNKIRGVSSFEFLKQNDLKSSQICPSTNSRKLLSHESEYFRSRIQADFNREVVLLDTKGSLFIFKGYIPILSFSFDVDLPKLVPVLLQNSKLKISSLSNPKNTRLTLHFNSLKEAPIRVDFSFKNKIRDQILQL